jgi:hypothetical protein
MPNAFYTLARDVFTTEFSSQTGLASLSQISGWFSANLGQLNSKIHTNFSGDANDMDSSAGAIFSLMYLRDFNQRAARSALRGVLSAGGNVLSIQDNDNRISFVNTKEVAKEYQTAAKDLTAEIDKLSYNYCLYGASPRQVVELDGTTGIYYY